MPGPSSSTISTASPPVARGLRAHPGARRGVADRVLQQVERPADAARRATPRPPRRLGVDRAARGARPSARARPRPRSATSAEVGGAVGLRRAGRRRAPAAAGRRPAGASGASSAAPPRRSRPARRSSSSVSSSRLASTLVSGVRSSCEASATNSRWRSSIAWVSVRGGVERAEHPLERAGQLGDLVLGLGVGEPPAGVARCARSRARRRSARRSGASPARTTNSPASRARTVPPSTPSSRNTWTRRERVVDVGQRPRVEQRDRRRSA